MFLHVEECEHLKDYVLRIRFNTGEVAEVDLKDELYGEIFQPLQSIEFFKKCTCNPETNTIEWPNGADFAPEFLLEHGKVLA
jgi:hypothetical protein